nr:uncharacterized protein CI109_002465 [Kwoniella shandongensis]KAA5529124.1 hypothetical protein CI109_002465 [Kwoniella shandongensis]
MSFLPRLFFRPSALAGPSRLPLTLARPTSLPLTTAPFSSSAISMAGHKVKSHSGSKKRFFANASGMFKRAKKLRKLLPYA